MAGKDWAVFEREACRLYRKAGLDWSEGAAPFDLITGIMGPDSVRWAESDWLRGGGAAVRIGATWKIYLYRHHPKNNLRFIACHELSHIWLGRGATETECDALAACLLAPRPAFQSALREVGSDYAKLAKWFVTTEAWAALRFGEVTLAPPALVSPASVRIRGEWSLSSEPSAVRALAGQVAPGLRRARLRDDPRRIVLSVG
jgi:hypothetical protein